MFFIISKLLDFLINPLALFFLILALTCIPRFRKYQKRLCWSLCIMLYLAANPFLIDELHKAWNIETSYTPLHASQYAAAIVLGGIGEMDLEQQKINFKEGGDRLFQALALLKQGTVKKIIFTGGSGSIEYPDHKEGLFVKRYLKQLQIADSLAIIESESRNTYENALFTKPLLKNIQLGDSLLLVTSAAHMRRSLAIFNKCGITTCIPYATNIRAKHRRWNPEHLLIPNAEALRDFKNLVHEWIGYVIYKFKGYL